jgi:hypothetical protein
LQEILRGPALGVGNRLAAGGQQQHQGKQ